jgi:hypothetical protein
VVDGTGEADFTHCTPGVPLACDKTVLVNYTSFVRALPQLLMYALGGCWFVPAYPAGMIDTYCN